MDSKAPSPSVPSDGILVSASGPAIARTVRQRLPAGGLYADQHWRIAPGPFVLTEQLARDLESLGRVCFQFYRALQLLYRRSVEGKAPTWVASLLDQGKPAHLVELQRDAALRPEYPRILRPDLLLTETGIALTELDAVPGGIGLTTWLYEAYAAAIAEPSESSVSVPRPSRIPGLLGDRARMLEGFAGIFGTAPSSHILVSEESATYRPEMQWLADQLAGRSIQVHGGDFTGWREGDAVYRFFELFDLPNVPAAQNLLRDAQAQRIRLTPPPKPIFEEKLALALLWNRNLRDFWRQELGEGFLKRLLAITPYTWVLDPAPLPPHAAFPELHLTDWRQLKLLSQRDRDLILKISGFSENAWGARGVHLGSDLSAADWAEAVDNALAAWPDAPHILQRYHKPRVVEGAWFDFDRDAVVPMPSRVRLCPYYFVHGDGDAARPHLGGVLATLCPSDKKIIHGMRDAVLAPCAVASSDPKAHA
ncbi:MAG: hypothetical protein AB7O66_10600 [Limisphaerales bacterium]